MANETLALEQIIGYVPITGLMYETTTGVPDPLPEGFRTATKDVSGDAARLMVRRGQRKTAKRIEYGSPPRNAPLVSLGYKDMKMVHFGEEEAIPLNTLLKLRDTTDYSRQREGRDEVQEQAKQFAQKFVNTEIVTRQMVLSKGHLYFDADGNVLPSSSGATWDFDFLVPANNKNQLNGIIGASWATAATDIPTQIIKLQKQAVRQTGLEITDAFYTEQIPSYLFANTYMQQYLARNPGLNNQFLNTNMIPDGLLGIRRWHPVYNGFFEDQNDTNQDIWSADQITFTPDPGVGDWWRMFRGSIMVPTSLDVAGPGEAALRNAKEVFGMAGYGYIGNDIIKLIMRYFDTFLPALQNPDAIFIADVTP